MTTRLTATVVLVVACLLGVAHGTSLLERESTRLSLRAEEVECSQLDCGACAKREDCWWCGDDGGCQSNSDTNQCGVTNVDSTSYKYLFGGIEISSNAAKHTGVLHTGTLGAIGDFVSQTDGAVTVGGITNGHVVKDSVEALEAKHERQSSPDSGVMAWFKKKAAVVSSMWKGLGDYREIFNAAVKQRRQGGGDEFGELDNITITKADKGTRSTVDAALVSIYFEETDRREAPRPVRQYFCEIAELGPVYHLPPNADYRKLRRSVVFKRGRTTRVTEGKLGFCSDSDFNCQILPQNNKPFSMSGDSGSVVVNDKNQILGLMYSGSYSCSLIGGMSTGMIQGRHIFDEMGFNPCGKYTGFFEDHDFCNLSSYFRKNHHAQRYHTSCVDALTVVLEKGRAAPLRCKLPYIGLVQQARHLEIR